ALLTGLKQICNHPAQYLKESAPRLPGRSGKLDLLDELLTTILAEDGAALVFTQYVAMARLIERHLRDRGVPALLLHGGTPVARREELIRAFQDGQAPVLLLSLRAAGTGLNLTRADHVVHYDRWWNPAGEEQAAGRAHRIGQARPAQVHRRHAGGQTRPRRGGARLRRGRPQRTDRHRTRRTGGTEEEPMSGTDAEARGFPAFPAVRGRGGTARTWWGRAWIGAVEQAALDAD